MSRAHALGLLPYSAPAQLVINSYPSSRPLPRAPPAPPSTAQSSLDIDRLPATPARTTNEQACIGIHIRTLVTLVTPVPGGRGAWTAGGGEGPANLKRPRMMYATADASIADPNVVLVQAWYRVGRGKFTPTAGPNGIHQQSIPSSTCRCHHTSLYIVSHVMRLHTRPTRAERPT